MYLCSRFWKIRKTMAEDTKIQIINTAFELFGQYGIKSVSVDDVCNKLNISKKTFYVWFPQKTDLVEAVLNLGKQKFEERVFEVHRKRSVLENIMNIMQVFNTLEDVRKSPPLFFDLKKYYPELLKKHINDIFVINRKSLAYALQRGMEEGLFRTDLDVEMCTLYIHKMYVNVLERCDDRSQRAALRRETAFMLDIMLRGTLTDQGKAQMRALQEKGKKQ